MNALQTTSRSTATNWTLPDLALFSGLVCVSLGAVVVQTRTDARVMVAISAGVFLTLLALDVVGDPVRGGAIVLPAAFIVGTGFLVGPSNGGLRSLLAGLVVGAVLCSLRLLDPSMFAGNDVSVATAVGAAAGWFAWMTVAVVFVLGVVVNGLIAAIVLSRNRRDVRTFAVSPALIASALLTLAVLS